jgi:hypothetical protein
MKLKKITYERESYTDKIKMEFEPTENIERNRFRLEGIRLEIAKFLNVELDTVLSNKLRFYPEIPDEEVKKIDEFENINLVWDDSDMASAELMLMKDTILKLITDVQSPEAKEIFKKAFNLLDRIK